MTKISELPNTHTYPLRALAELRAKESNPNQTIARLSSNFNWHKTPEGVSFWGTVDEGQHPLIPAESIEDLRRAGMMPKPERDFELKPMRVIFDNKPEPVIKDFARVDTAPPPPFLCKIRHYGTPCARQCAECQATEGHNAPPVAMEDYPKPSITLEDYARMEAEHEAITSPSHYKVCEGLDVVDMIRAVLTPEQFSGYCLGNVIKYRMRAGKKTMSPMEDLGKAHVYETWLAEMEGGEG
jgi:hypothetical protein